MTPPWQAELEAAEATGEAAADLNLRTTPEYRALVDQLARSVRSCQAKLEGCTVIGTDPHHVYPVSEGGPVIVPLVWLRWVCRSCHGRIHSANHRPEAEAVGLIVPLSRKT